MDSENNTYMGNGIFCEEVEEMEDKRNRITDFLDSLDEDRRELLDIGVGLATIFVLGYVCYSLGVHIGKRSMVKEIDRAINSCLDMCKNEGQGVLLNMSTKKHKNFNVYICK